jgi:hypothetical protein
MEELKDKIAALLSGLTVSQAEQVLFQMLDKIKETKVTL